MSDPRRFVLRTFRRGFSSGILTRPWLRGGVVRGGRLKSRALRVLKQRRPDSGRWRRLVPPGPGSWVRGPSTATGTSWAGGRTARKGAPPTSTLGAGRQVGALCSGERRGRARSGEDVLCSRPRPGTMTPSRGRRRRCGPLVEVRDDAGRPPRRMGSALARVRGSTAAPRRRRFAPLP